MAVSAKEMSRGMYDGLSDLQHGISTNFTNLMTEAIAGLTAATHVLRQTGIDCRTYIYKTTQAHYHCFGQYTYPLKLNGEAPTISSLFEGSSLGKFIVGQSALTPLIIPTWAASTLVYPTVGNSITGGMQIFKFMVNKTLPNEREFKHEGPWHHCSNNTLGILYSSPGLLVGGAFGTTTASMIATIRSIHAVVTNTCESTCHTAATLLNLALPADSKKTSYRFKKTLYTYEPTPSKRIAGVLGYPLGFTIGALTASVVAATRGIHAVVANTYKNTYRTTANISNLALPKRLEFEITSDDSRSNLHKAAGVLGYPLGATIGSVAASVVAATRGINATIGNSITGGMRIFKFMVNKTLPNEREFKHEGPWHHCSNNTLGILYSSPGLLVGGAFGTTTASMIATIRSIHAVVTNTCESTCHTAATLLNLALPADKEDGKNPYQFNETLGNYNPTPSKRIAGVLGYPLGLTIGTLAASVVAATRGIHAVVANTYKNTYRTTANISNLALPKRLEFKITSDDSRSNLHKAAGVLGYPLGLTIGTLAASVVAATRGIHAVVANTYKNTYRTTANISNLALPKRLEFEITSDDSRSNLHKAAGVLGYPLGVTIGSVAASVVAATRGIHAVVANTCENTCQVTTALLNRALPKRLEIEITSDDSRSNLHKAAGVLGYPLGVTIGSVAASVVAATRGIHAVVANTYKNTYRTTANISNLALPKRLEFEITSDDSRSNLHKAAGVLGYPLGLTIGTLAASVVAATRGIHAVVANTYKNTCRTTANISNLALPKRLEFEITSDDSRSNLHKAAGVLGYPLGVTIGSVAASVVAATRGIHAVVANTYKNTYRTTANISNLALPKRLEFEIASDDSRSNLHKAAGVLGYPLGLTIGTLAASVVAATRGIHAVVANTYKNTCRTTANISNLALPKRLEFEITSDDSRSNLHKAAGVLGYPLGLTIGTLAASVVAATRGIHAVVANTYKNTCRTTANISNLALPKRLEFEITSDDSRSNLHKAAGVLGYPLGATIGSVAASVVAATRGIHAVVANTCENTCQVTTALLNRALPKRLEFEITSDDSRSNLHKAAGVLGYPLGATIGSVAAIATTIINSFVRTSMASLNVLHYESPYHTAFSNDNRPPVSKAIGHVGTIAALASVGTTLGFFCQVAPKIATTALCATSLIIVTPPHAIIKLLSYADQCSRTPKSGDPTDDTFKQFEDSLSTTGRLIPGPLLKNTTSLFSLGRFFYRSATFLSKTPTEKTISRLRKAYSSSRSKNSFFNSPEYDATLATLKDSYREQSCTCGSQSNNDSEKNCKEVDKVAALIKDHIQPPTVTGTPFDIDAPADFYKFRKPPTLPIGTLISGPKTDDKMEPQLTEPLLTETRTADATLSPA